MPFKTSIEFLPDEIFLEIFDYLTDVDVVYGFSKLNRRFDALILSKCRTFDFQLVNKTKFDYVVRQHNIHRWRSLFISDGDHTPGQAMYFLQSLSSSQNYSKLTTLSVSNMKPKTATLFANQLILFPCLVSLTFGTICGKTIPSISLPTLKHVNIKSCMYSSWMKNLGLSSLQHAVKLHCNHEFCLVWPKTLKQLDLYVEHSSESLLVRQSIQQLYQLTNLTLCDAAWGNIVPDGQIWEQLIKLSLPLLKSFKFCFSFWTNFYSINDIHRVIKTFSTTFYLEEKSWYVQCNYQRQRFGKNLLYSVPFAFEHFEIVSSSTQESISILATFLTKISIKDTFRYIKKLTINTTYETASQAFIPTNITDLSLDVSVDSNSFIFSLKQLNILSIGSQFSMSSDNFIHLLQNNPQLKALTTPYHVLELLTNQWNNRKLCNLLKQKVRSLTILPHYELQVATSQSQYVSVEKLLPIVRIFGGRCRHLTISIRSRNLIISFILKNMQRLRSLNVHLHANDHSRSSTNEWLAQENVTLKHFDYFVIENDDGYSFWIGHRS